VLVVLKGSASSGWYAPPKGTHSGEKHRSVGSGKSGAAEESAQKLIQLSGNDEMYQYALAANWSEWRDGLSDEEIGAYLRYSTKKGVSMNEYLRHPEGKRHNEKIEAAIEGIDESMRENPSEIEVHRAVDFSLYIQLGLRMKIGDSFKDDGYVSTSLVKQNYMEAMPLKIRIAKGVKVAYLAELSATDKRPVLSPRWAKEEQELLVHRGATMVKVGQEGTIPIFEIRE
jgi:hypothetical protein